MNPVVLSARELSDVHREPWLQADAKDRRCSLLGMKTPQVMAFTSACEFISLGCFCGVARTLQALDLTRFSYPFDWVRCSLDGLMHCLDMRFEDFTSFSSQRLSQLTGLDVFTMAWGGSMWHHDPRHPECVTMFT